MKFSEKEKREIISVVRKVILSEFENENELGISSELRELASKIGGVYVTLKKDGALRGRSGTAENELIGKALIEHSKKAAFEDQRFMPVKKEEIKDIKIEVNFLLDIKLVSNEKVVDDIKVGKSGIIIKSGAYSSILLPQECESSWTKENFLENACIKAGLLPDAWKNSTTTIYLFNSEVISE